MHVIIEQGIYGVFAPFGLVPVHCLLCCDPLWLMLVMVVVVMVVMVVIVVVVMVVMVVMSVGPTVSSGQ